MTVGAFACVFVVPLPSRQGHTCVRERNACYTLSTARLPARPEGYLV